MTALRVNLLAVGARVLYRVSCPALAIKGKLSEWRPLIGPASCTRARRVHTGALGARDFRERGGRGDNSKGLGKIKGKGLMS